MATKNISIWFFLQELSIGSENVYSIILFRIFIAFHFHLHLILIFNEIIHSSCVIYYYIYIYTVTNCFTSTFSFWYTKKIMKFNRIQYYENTTSLINEFHGIGVLAQHVVLIAYDWNSNQVYILNKYPYTITWLFSQFCRIKRSFVYQMPFLTNSCTKKCSNSVT